MRRAAFHEAVCLLLGNIIHVGVLLLPTAVLGWETEQAWATAFFAFGIAAAAVLEGLSVPLIREVGNPVVRDKMAMGVAQLVGIALLLFFWLAQVESGWRGDGNALVQGAGAICLISGIALRVQAIRTLKDRFVSDIQVGQPIECEGIYKWLRHPSEVGLLLIAVGAPLLLGATLTAIGAAIVLLPVSAWRTHRENVALAAGAASCCGAGVVQGTD